jgi:hypothetical protein
MLTEQLPYLGNAALKVLPLFACAGLLNQHIHAYEEHGPISMQSAVEYRAACISLGTFVLVGTHFRSP